MDVENTIRSLQESLIENAEGFLHGESLPPRIKNAFFETPRHLFVPRFQDGTPGLWQEVNDSTLLQHLNTLYADQPYCIYQNEKGETLSTISQPSLVLFMLHLLDIQEGMSVFELGGGSGWNAALMSRLVGEKGRVTSVEIIPSLVENARKALSKLGISNVSLIAGDAYSFIADQEPFDRGVFTASAWELPAFFFEKIKDHGLLLFVVSFTASSDLLILLRKTDGHFVSETHFPCRFVPITGDIASESRQLPSAEEIRFHRELNLRAEDIESVALKIYPGHEYAQTGPNHYAFNRGDSFFVWSFPN